MRSFAEGRDFKELLLADPDVMRVLTRAEVERAFDLDEQFRHVDEIFARVYERTTANAETAEIGGGRPKPRPAEPASLGQPRAYVND